MTTSTATVAERAGGLLRRLAGPDARFRDGQLSAIEALVEQRRRVLVVQRTGWGKSAVYFIATRLLRDEGAGPALLVSPLLALMRNQIDAATKLGVHAVTINSANRDDWDGIEAKVAAGDVDLLLISPERLNNPRFRDDVLPHIAETVGLLVVDEVHCISDWGHDFRPDYRRVARVLDLLPPGVPVLGCTATANDRVVADVAEQFGHDLASIRGPLERDSLVLSVADLPSQAERLAWLASQVPTFSGSGIVYCLTIADAERVAAWLRLQGIEALAYTGKTDNDERLAAEAALLANEVKVLVATSALGMGYDKGDLSFVVHFQSPGSPIAYYQQVGRAGRALDRADVVLLRGHEDREIQDYFIGVAFPPRDKAEAVIALLDAAGGPVKQTAIEAEVNVRHARLEGMLKILEVDDAVARSSAGWVRTSHPWAYDEERVERVTAARRAEQAAMASYGTNGECLMRFLRDQLDDPSGVDCGRCSVCLGRGDHEARAALDPAAVAEAQAFLRSRPLAIEPRAQWPAGLDEVRGRIPPDHRLEEGRALSVWADGGWGGLVQRGRDEDGVFDDELVDAAAEVVRRSWRPRPYPEWVTAVPSARRRGLVAPFATRLAEALGLPFVAALEKERPTEAQHRMENSAQQVRNVHGAFRVTSDALSGPVLLVDDLVDSRWTLTEAGVALREAGTGPVLPLVLATKNA